MSLIGRESVALAVRRLGRFDRVTFASRSPRSTVAFPVPCPADRGGQPEPCPVGRSVHRSSGRCGSRGRRAFQDLRVPGRAPGTSRRNRPAGRPNRHDRRVGGASLAGAGRPRSRAARASPSCGLLRPPRVRTTRVRASSISTRSRHSGPLRGSRRLRANPERRLVVVVGSSAQTPSSWRRWAASLSAALSPARLAVAEGSSDGAGMGATAAPASGRIDSL